jgi:hypothetical protein
MALAALRTASVTFEADVDGFDPAISIIRSPWYNASVR